MGVPWHTGQDGSNERAQPEKGGLRNWTNFKENGSGGEGGGSLPRHTPVMDIYVSGISRIYVSGPQAYDFQLDHDERPHDEAGNAMERSLSLRFNLSYVDGISTGNS